MYLDVIKLSIYESGNLIKDEYIFQSDIINKNEKYKLLADMIFNYLNLFLN